MPGPLRLFPQIKGGEQCGDPISGSWGVTKMMSFVSLLLVGILFHATQAEQLTKCEVFQKLKDLKDYGGVSLPECEFPAILLCSIIHPLHSFPPFSSTSFFPLLLIKLSNNSLICLLFYYIYLCISPFSRCLILWNSFHLIKILCGLPYLEIGWRAFFCLGIQVLIYAIHEHPCEFSFSSFFQGSVLHFIPVVMTHKP